MPMDGVVLRATVRGAVAASAAAAAGARSSSGGGPRPRLPAAQFWRLPARAEHDGRPARCRLPGLRAMLPVDAVRGGLAARDLCSARGLFAGAGGTGRRLPGSRISSAKPPFVSWRRAAAEPAKAIVHCWRWRHVARAAAAAARCPVRSAARTSCCRRRSGAAPSATGGEPHFYQWCDTAARPASVRAARSTEPSATRSSRRQRQLLLAGWRNLHWCAPGRRSRRLAGPVVPTRWIRSGLGWGESRLGPRDGGYVAVGTRTLRRDDPSGADGSERSCRRAAPAGADRRRSTSALRRAGSDVDGTFLFSAEPAGRCAPDERLGHPPPRKGLFGTSEKLRPFDESSERHTSTRTGDCPLVISAYASCPG